MAVKPLAVVVLVLATLAVAHAASCTANQTTGLKKTLIGGATSVNSFMADAVVVGKTGFGSFCYVSEGSGYGRSNVLSGGLHIGVSDVPIAAISQWVAAFGRQLAGPPSRTGVLQMPTLVIYFGVATSSGVPAMSYLGKPLPAATAYKMGTSIRADSLAGIWNGTIRDWAQVHVSQGSIVSGCGIPSNPCPKPWPSRPIGVAYRSDSSGSTQVFITFFTVSAYYRTYWKVPIASTWPANLRNQSNWVGQDGTSTMYKYLNNTSAWAIGYLQAGYIKGEIDGGIGAKLRSVNIINAAGRAGNVWTTKVGQTLPTSIPTYNDTSISTTWNIINKPGAVTAPIAATPFFLARENYNLVPAAGVLGAGPAPAAQRTFIKPMLNSVNKLTAAVANAYAVGLPPSTYRNKNLLAVKGIIGA